MNSYKNSSHFEGLYKLTHQILQLSNEPLTRTEFLQEMSGLLLDFSNCDLVEFDLMRIEDSLVWRLVRRTREALDFQYLSFSANEDDYSGELKAIEYEYKCFLSFCSKITSRDYDEPLSNITSQGTFWSNDLNDTIKTIPDEYSFLKTICQKYIKSFSSIVIIPLIVGEKCIGFLKLLSKNKEYFSLKAIAQYDNLSPIFGLTLLNNRAQAALRERVKELSCLYEIAKNSAKPGISLDEIMLSIANLLPPAWQYPKITTGRIVLDGKNFTTPDFIEGVDKQSAEIVINQQLRGFVEINYIEKKPVLLEGPFLTEERKLINEIARQVAMVVERWEVTQEKLRLQEQLRHADRLATIGQLAAGVAHELNEPLGSILGFAQLVNKTQNLPETVEKDIGKIISSSLYAREIVKKLLIFARQVPTTKFKININRLIEETISFFEARCTKDSIEVIKQFNLNIPEIYADPGQLNQVIVNLVVNAMQAMPNGGRLILKTYLYQGEVIISVADSGVGMSEDTIKQIFVPFFTTKDINQGTGLGLAVVHGIVSGHGGRINVSSVIGKGSNFEVHLPIREFSDEGS